MEAEEGRMLNVSGQPCLVGLCGPPYSSTVQQYSTGVGLLGRCYHR